MAQTLLAAAGSIAPPVVLFLALQWWIRADRVGGRRHIGRLVVFGALAVVPAALVEGVAAGLGYLTGLPESAGIGAFALVVAFTEEGLKLLILRRQTRGIRSLVSVADGVRCGTAVGLGFALAENVLYALGALADDQLVLILILRAVLAVPGHAAWGVVMGGFMGQARFANDGARRVHESAALLFPVTGHALYDLGLLSAALLANEDATAAGVLALGAVVVFLAGLAGAIAMLVASRRDRRRYAPGQQERLALRWQLVRHASPPAGGRYCVDCGGRTTGADVVCRWCSRAWARPTPTAHEVRSGGWP